MRADQAVELEVSNFGPIVEGQIDLRPLTVFVGPSNTGKSYLAILIYALHRFFQRNYGLDGIGRPIADRRWQTGREVPNASVAAAGEWLDGLFGEASVRQVEQTVSLGPLSRIIASALESGGEGLHEEIGRCFGADGGALTRKGARSGARLLFRKGPADGSGGYAHTLTFRPEALSVTLAPDLEFVPVDPEGFHFELGHLQARRRRGGRWQNDLPYRRLVDVVTRAALPALVGDFARSAHYLPADRTGVMHAHGVVVSALIEAAANTGLRVGERIPTLSGVLADFLKQLIALEPFPLEPRGIGAARADRMEESLLLGGIETEPMEGTGFPRFTYRPRGWTESLPLLRTSSMVSELAPVILFLRHCVLPEDLLIVEEPEAHLHPAMQVEFTRQLVALASSGIRVLVTTHSEWVLEELSNVVLASALPEEKRRDMLEGDIALGEDDVGVWAFRPRKRPRGTRIEEVRLAAAGGLYSASFDDVSARTYNDWARIASLAEKDA